MYVIHPAITPGVAWIPGRVDIILSILSICSVWSFMTYHKSGKSLWIGLHLFLFALGLFNKETAIAIPAICIMLIYYFSKPSESTQSGHWSFLFSLNLWKDIGYSTLKWIKTNGFIISGWLIIVISWYILRKNALTDDPYSILGALSQLGSSWMELSILFSVIFLPFKLQVFLKITGIFIAMAIPGFALFYWLPRYIKTNSKNFLFGVFWLFIFLLPTTLSSLLNYHRLAVPLIGMAFILAPLDNLTSKKHRNFTLLLVSLFGLFFLYENIQFQKAFTNRKSFWINAQHYSPSSTLANNGLAWCYHLNHQNDSALWYYQNVVNLDPNIHNIRLGMAMIEEEKGNLLRADSLLIEEFKVTKDSTNLYFYLGQIQLERTDTNSALINLQRGYPVTEYSRNARLYYDTLDQRVKGNLRILENQSN